MSRVAKSKARFFVDRTNRIFADRVRQTIISKSSRCVPIRAYPARVRLGRAILIFRQKRGIIFQIAFAFERRNVANRNFFFAEKFFLQNFVQPFDITQTRFVNPRRQMNQLFVPGFEHFGGFFKRKFVVLRRLQKRIFLTNDAVVIRQSLDKRRIDRDDSAVEKFAARFGPFRARFRVRRN